MKKIILSALLLSVTAIAGAQEPIAIVKQGHFSVGGTTIQRPGTYDNSFAVIVQHTNVSNAMQGIAK